MFNITDWYRLEPESKVVVIPYLNHSLPKTSKILYDLNLHAVTDYFCHTMIITDKIYETTITQLKIIFKEVRVYESLLKYITETLPCIIVKDKEIFKSNTNREVPATRYQRIHDMVCFRVKEKYWFDLYQSLRNLGILVIHKLKFRSTFTVLGFEKNGFSVDTYELMKEIKEYFPHTFSLGSLEYHTTTKLIIQYDDMRYFIGTPDISNIENQQIGSRIMSEYNETIHAIWGRYGGRTF